MDREIGFIFEKIENTVGKGENVLINHFYIRHNLITFLDGYNSFIFDKKMCDFGFLFQEKKSEIFLCCFIILICNIYFSSKNSLKEKLTFYIQQPFLKRLFGLTIN